MAANIIGMTVVSLAERGWSVITPQGGAAMLRNAALLVALALLVCLVSAGGWLYATGLWGMTAFLLVLLVWIALIVSTERQQTSAS